jgi:hypothetical protein
MTDWSAMDVLQMCRPVVSQCTSVFLATSNKAKRFTMSIQTANPEVTTIETNICGANAILISVPINITMSVNM